MKSYWIAIVGLLLCAGCMPLKQGTLQGVGRYDYFGYDNGYGLLQIGPSNVKKTAILLPKKSYAISPSGKKLRIESEEHDYDIEQKDIYIRDEIYVVSENGKRLKELSNGKWKFVFSLLLPTGPAERVFEGTITTFYYNPIIHGPPN